MGGIKFKIGDLCLILNIVEILSLILRDQVNKCSEGLAILVNSPCLPVTCWVNIYRGTEMVITAGVIMGLVGPAAFVSPISAFEAERFKRGGT